MTTETLSWERLTIGLPEGVVNRHSVRPQGRLVVHLRAGLCELVCLHHSQLCPVSKEHVSLKQAYSKRMRDDGAATSYCLPVIKRYTCVSYHCCLLLF